MAAYLIWWEVSERGVVVYPKEQFFFRRWLSSIVGRSRTSGCSLPEGVAAFVAASGVAGST